METDLNIEGRIAANVSTVDAQAAQKNAATNGRLFSALMVLICLAAFIKGHGAFYAQLAMFAAIPVGVAVVLDGMAVGFVRKLLSLTTYFVSSSVALTFLVTIG
jgi:hypothetical protein